VSRATDTRFTIYGSRFTKEEVSGPLVVALEARADEAVAEGALEVRADAEQFAPRPGRVRAHERAPVRGDFDRRGLFAQSLGRLAAREGFDARRVERPPGDEAVAVNYYGTDYSPVAVE